jgi:DNA-binding NarL/FixJ family response regulator
MIDTHGMTRIRVLLVEDHNMVRQGLRALLTAEDSMVVVGEARNGHDAIQQVKKLRPDVVVMDIAMPLLNGVEATRQIRGLCPATKVLILSAHKEDEYVEQATKAGAAGYVIKENAADVLVNAILEVHRGGRYFSASISKRLDDLHETWIAHGKRQGTRVTRLTSREKEVLQLIAEGMANKETAAHLGISIKTVEKHRQHLKDKLGIHDTAGLTRYALSAGIIESSGPITFE